MHGRLKVRTSAEEKERKNIERALKVKAYKAAMTKIKSKKDANEFDDELFQLTTQLLLRNPDIALLWNIRRECILRKLKQIQEDEEAQQVLYNGELSFTENCLKGNPKSYCSWHQRCWILEHNKQANYDLEVKLCNKYLKLDERNFHTWDYRRHVVAKAGLLDQQEFDYCTEKIKTNFSNYSSWHQRSLLLSKLYANENPKEHAICQEKLKQELDMVLTAAFTDPNDSSAWFYQRWLLDSAPTTDNEVCAFRCNNEKAVLVFAKPIALEETATLKLCEDDVEKVVLKNWQSQNKRNVDVVWSTNMPVVELNKTRTWHAYIEKQQIPLRFLNDDSLIYFKPPNYGFTFAEVVLDELKRQLKSCEDLLTYEPENKWALLTTAFIMRAIDVQAYHSSSLAHIETVTKVDSLREGYYKDLLSKWILEKKFKDWLLTNPMEANLVLNEEDKLFSLPYKHYFSIMDTVKLPECLNNYKINTFASFLN